MIASTCRATATNARASGRIFARSLRVGQGVGAAVGQTVAPRHGVVGRFGHAEDGGGRLMLQPLARVAFGDARVLREFGARGRAERAQRAVEPQSVAKIDTERLGEANGRSRKVVRRAGRPAKAAPGLQRREESRSLSSRSPDPVGGACYWASDCRTVVEACSISRLRTISSPAVSRGAPAAMMGRSSFQSPCSSNS